MDNKYTGLVMAAPTVARDPGYPNILIVFLGAILMVIGYVLINFVIPWMAETVCALLYNNVSWGNLIGFH